MLNRGLPVYRGTRMTFSQNARFTCNYNGANTYVRQNFSAFAFEGGVTFDGLNIIASGIRNVIHDDFDNNFVGNTIIKNCHIIHDYIILAGGLAFHENVEIYNNYFERTDITTHVFDISYHNNGTSGAQSNLIIKDNYFSKGISIRYYGSSTLISDCLISNNSMANEIEYRAENSSATIQNVRVLSWNNPIRN
jgi:polygalacturonase